MGCSLSETSSFKLARTTNLLPAPNYASSQPVSTSEFNQTNQRDKHPFQNRPLLYRSAPERGEDRRSLLDRNVSIFKGEPPTAFLFLMKSHLEYCVTGIVPQLVKYSPDTILLVVSNPVDVMAYITWKLSGLPSHRVFGSGTSLDSSRLRHQMSERLGIDPTSCHGYVIGEHGEASGKKPQITFEKFLDSFCGNTGKLEASK